MKNEIIQKLKVSVEREPIYLYDLTKGRNSVLFVLWFCREGVKRHRTVDGDSEGSFSLHDVRE